MRGHGSKPCPWGASHGGNRDLDLDARLDGDRRDLHHDGEEVQIDEPLVGPHPEHVEGDHALAAGRSN